MAEPDRIGTPLDTMVRPAATSESAGRRSVTSVSRLSGCPPTEPRLGLSRATDRRDSFAMLWSLIAGGIGGSERAEASRLNRSRCLALTPAGIKVVRMAVQRQHRKTTALGAVP